MDFPTWNPRAFQVHRGHPQSVFATEDAVLEEFEQVPEEDLVIRPVSDSGHQQKRYPGIPEMEGF